MTPYRLVFVSNSAYSEFVREKERSFDDEDADISDNPGRHSANLILRRRLKRDDICLSIPIGAIGACSKKNPPKFLKKKGSIVSICMNFSFPIS